MASQLLVEGDMYQRLDGKLSEIKRQMRQSGGYPHNPVKLLNGLQKLIDGIFEESAEEEELVVEVPKVIPLELLPVPRTATPAEKWNIGTQNLFRQFMGIDIQPELEKFAWQENRPHDFGWFVFCPKGFTATDAIEKLCKPQFTTGVNIDPAAYTCERDASEPRLVLCRDTIEPDKIWLGKSGDDMQDARREGKEIPFLDHRERYVLEAIYYYIFKKHLDIVGLTRCPRSRSGDGVAGAGWCGGVFGVSSGHRDYRYPDGGGREAIVLPLKPS